MKQSSSKNEVNYVKVINCNNNVKKGTIVTEQFIMIILLIALGYLLKRINF